MIVAVVGLSGTGKSVVTRRLAVHHGYGVVYFGGVVLDEVTRRGLELTPANERLVREELRGLHGMAAMAVQTEARLRVLFDAGTDVAIDGLYSHAEYEYLTNAGFSIRLLAVHASRQLRYQRLGLRPIRPLTPAQIDERDYSELRNLDKAVPIVMADVHIVNDDDQAALERAVDHALGQLRPRKDS
ncbi:MAG: AAA family ATPase [Kofleriaceae bacterium]|nr:AAA family ATPase [Kofleriaceae bacterium]MBP9861048.1 AAA family ATPase [Kofleriaceae bacterium]